ncbi:MAG: putative membrane protein [Bacteroidia bacterium]|jgi:uncharacterized membrane protein
MDMNSINDSINIIVKLFERILLYPFMILFSIGSRIGYEYFVNKKIPKKGEIFAITLTGAFVSTMVYLTCSAYGVEQKYKLILVSIFGFIGHTALTYLLEHQQELFNKLISLLGLKKK